mmetsp:Transcript_1659/g.1720  ORF Transcript_1659/g.1720 Transcript_1659/m.1720 type:complete len:80 (+) Transcript_1659:1140-1379(+)
MIQNQNLYPFLALESCILYQTQQKGHFEVANDSNSFQYKQVKHSKTKIRMLCPSKIYIPCAPSTAPRALRFNKLAPVPI